LSLDRHFKIVVTNLQTMLTACGVWLVVIGVRVYRCLRFHFLAQRCGPISETPLVQRSLRAKQPTAYLLQSSQILHIPTSSKLKSSSASDELMH